MSDEGQRDTWRKTPRWESELWSYLSWGDGTKCPVHESCQLRLHNVPCCSNNEEYFKALNEFVDTDVLDLSCPSSIKLEFLGCPRSGRIFKLVSRLAARYQVEAGIDRLPMPDDLITRAYDNLPIEVRRVPLKAYHGAIWRLSDCWLVHLNSNDTPARQRFTLYHEIFHILAHCRATTVFKTSGTSKGYFNELLADRFAAVILLPEKWVREKWAEVKDLGQMAAIFDVPMPVIWFGLKQLRLI